MTERIESPEARNKRNLLESERLYLLITEWIRAKSNGLTDVIEKLKAVAVETPPQELPHPTTPFNLKNYLLWLLSHLQQDKISLEMASTMVSISEAVLNGYNAGIRKTKN